MSKVTIQRNWPGQVWQASTGGGGGGGPAFSDDFPSGDLTHTENGYAWGTGSSGVSVVDGSGKGGGYGLEITFPAQADGSDSQHHQHLDFGNTREVWIDFDLKIPSNYNHRDQSEGATNNKFFQIWGVNGRTSEPKEILEIQRTDPVNSGDRDASWVRFGEGGGHVHNQICSSGDFACVYNDNEYIKAVDHGSWIRVRWHFRTGRPSDADAAIELWKDDTQHHSDLTFDDIGVEDDTQNFLNTIRLFGWSNSGYDSETTFVFDNFKVYESDPDW